MNDAQASQLQERAGKICEMIQAGTTSTYAAEDIETLTHSLYDIVEQLARNTHENPEYISIAVIRKELNRHKWTDLSVIIDRLLCGAEESCTFS